VGRLVLATVTAVALGCTPAATAVSFRQPARSLALDLLWSIEGHATECTLVRAAILSDRRRSLLADYRPQARLGYVLPDSRTGPRVGAYVSCVVGDESGARAISRLAFSRPVQDEERDAIAASLPFDARWLDRPCEEGSCGTRTIELVRPDVLEIVGALHVGVQTSSPDVRRALAEEVATRDAIVEITVAQVEGTRAHVLESLERGPRGIAVTQRVVDRDDFWTPAHDAAELARFDALGGDPLAGFRMRGDVFERYLPIPWALVEMAVADLQIAERARVRRASRDRVVPIDEIDLDSPQAVQRQAGARAIATRVTHDPERRRRLQQDRATLLTRLFELTEDGDAVVEAIELLLALGAIEQARALASAAVLVARDRPGVRGALVHAVALDAGLLDGAIASLRPELSAEERATLAAATPAAVALGIDWPTIERSFDVRRSTLVRAPHVVEPVSLPTDALAELGYLLLRAQAAQGPFAIMVRGPLRPDAPSATGFLALRWPEPGGRATWASVPNEAPSLERLRWISSALRAQLPSRGEVDVTAVLGGTPITLRLLVDGADARLVASSRSLHRSSWTALARDVARPVVSLEGTRFPFPVLRLALPDATLELVARRLVAERGGLIAGGECQLEPRTLVCTGTERGPEALLDALVVVTEEALRR